MRDKDVQGISRPVAVAHHSSLILALSSLAALLVVCGCATHADRIAPVREAFYAGRLETAVEELDKRRDVRLRNDDVKQLDRAMIELASGRPRTAERLLREVRNRFDHLEQTSVAERAGSLFWDDNVKAYAGEDYEKVLIRAFLALSNLMTDGGDAAAYALQMTEKQAQIIEAAPAGDADQPQPPAYKQVALGPYIGAMLSEESPLTLNDAARSRLQVVNWSPGFRDGPSDLERAKHGRPLAPGCGVLYVFALVGRGPVKEEVAEIPTQAALLIADRIISAQSKHGLPPTLAPVKVPVVRRSLSPADAIAVHVGDEGVGETAVLLNIGEMAEAQHRARFPQILAEAVVRRVVKKGAVYAVKDATDSGGSLAGFALDLLGIAWEATESADTRCWSLLPDSIQVLRIELPAGEHDLALTATRHRTAIGPAAHTRVRIHDGRNTCVLAAFPSKQLVGQVLVSGMSE